MNAAQLQLRKLSSEDPDSAGNDTTDASLRLSYGSFSAMAKHIPKSCILTADFPE